MPWPSDSEHNTLVASTVTTVTLDQDYSEVSIIHHGDNSSPVYALVDSGATDPAVAGAGTDVVLSGGYAVLPAPGGGGTATQVKLVSAGTPTVSVIAGGR